MLALLPMRLPYRYIVQQLRVYTGHGGSHSGHGSDSLGLLGGVDDGTSQAVPETHHRSSGGSSSSSSSSSNVLPPVALRVRTKFLRIASSASDERDPIDLVRRLCEQGEAAPAVSGIDTNTTSGARGPRLRGDVNDNESQNAASCDDDSTMDGGDIYTTVRRPSVFVSNQYNRHYISRAEVLRLVKQHVKQNVLRMVRTKNAPCMYHVVSRRVALPRVDRALSVCSPPIPVRCIHSGPKGSRAVPV